MASSTDRPPFREAVEAIALKAKATLPACNGRIDLAVKLVLQGDVALLGDGTAQVFSQSNGVTSYHLANGTCDCEDYQRAPSHWCKHRSGDRQTRAGTAARGARSGARGAGDGARRAVA
jgi:hypothetical protein